MKLGIFGAGEQAKELLNLYEKGDYYGEKYEEIILVDLLDNKEKNVISEDYFFRKPIKDYNVIVAMGEPHMRKKVQEKLKNKGYTFATFIHKSANIGNNTVINPGTIIFPFVYIAQSTIIAENTLVHAGARIENDCQIGKNCMVSSGAFIGAKTKIGDTTFVGPNSSVIDGITIGDDVIIGMSSCVLRNVDDMAVVVGNPARFIRQNIDGKIFG